MPLPLPPGARVPDRVVWINGRMVRGDEAALSVFDRGARDGGGLFETLRCQGGEPLAWTEHMERLVLGAAELGFPVPPAPARLLEAARSLLAAQSLSEAVVRITVTRGIPGGRPVRTGAWIEAEPLASRLWAGERSGAAAVVLSGQAFEPGSIGRYKTTSRIAWDLAREEARARGADEALLVTPAGHVLEGGASNLFAVFGGEVRTPPLAANILPGITRAHVLALCAELGVRAREAAIHRDALATADEVFLTNSVQQVLPVGALEGRTLPSREVGQRLREAYRARTASRP